MKTYLKISVVTLIFLMGSTLLGQNLKFGHINSQELLSMMPERDSAQLVLENYAKKLENQLESMQVEYNNKIQQYLAEQENYSDLIKQTKEDELTNIQERIQNFQATAQQDLQRKEGQLIQPILDKANKAIKDVGKEKGFLYIFDTARGSVLYFSEQSENILPLVKKKLNIE